MFHCPSKENKTSGNMQEATDGDIVNQDNLLCLVTEDVLFCGLQQQLRKINS